MEKEITIVTAFFKINRESWKGFSRSDDLYFQYFKDWAKLQNKIIVYVETESLKEKIMDYRGGLGLADKTVVNVIDDILDIDNELYNSILKASSQPIQNKYRLYPENPEVWNATYDYIMLLKMWCVSDAINRKQADGMVAWVDFGYNHGGAILDKKSNFHFLWKYDFPEKINLFLIQELDNRPIFDIVLSMDTYIMGMIIVGEASLWKPFWCLMRQCMMELNNCGLIDDDQNIILMAYRKNPQMFNTYRSGWQLPMQQFGGNHLIIKPSVQHNAIYRFAKKIRKGYRCFLYASTLGRHMFNTEIH